MASNRRFFYIDTVMDESFRFGAVYGLKFVPPKKSILILGRYCDGGAKSAVLPSGDASAGSS